MFQEYPKYVPLPDGKYRIFDNAAEYAKYFGIAKDVPVAPVAMTNVTVFPAPTTSDTPKVAWDEEESQPLMTKEDLYTKLTALNITYDKRWSFSKLHSLLEIYNKSSA